MNNKILIGLADENIINMMGMKSLITLQNNFEIVFEILELKKLMTSLKELEKLPSILILNLNNADNNCNVNLLKNLKTEYERIKCIVISQDNEYDTVFKYMDAGAKAFINRNDLDYKKLHEIIEQVNIRGIYICDFVLKCLIEYSKKKTCERDKEIDRILIRNKLCKREFEFIKYCCTDMAYKEIAETMKINPRTIDSYRDSVFRKLNIKNRSSVVVYAIKNKMIKL